MPELLYPAVDVYLGQSRPVLLGNAADTGALWISSTTGQAMTKKILGTLISKITLRQLALMFHRICSVLPLSPRAQC